MIESPNYSPQKVNVADQSEDLASLLNFVKRLIKLRKQIKVLSSSNFDWAEVNGKTLGIAAYWRQSKQDNFLAVHNFSDTAQNVSIQIPESLSGLPQELFNNLDYNLSKNNTLDLELTAHQFSWFHWE